MADRVFQALDMLAGVAGDEIEKARQFKMAQQQRKQALAEKAREFGLKQEELDLSKERVETGKENAELRKREYMLNLKKSQEKEFADKFSDVLEAENQLSLSYNRGIDNPSTIPLRLAYQRLGIEFPGEPDFNPKVRRGVSNRYIPTKERLFSQIVSEFDPNKSLEQNYQSLSPKEQEIFDKQFRAVSMQELMQGLLTGGSGGFQFPVEE